MPRDLIRAAMIVLWFLTFAVAGLGIFIAPHFFIASGVLMGSAAIFTGVYYTDKN